MAQEREIICFNCIHWHPDPEALSTSPQEITHKLINLEGIPLVYGHCRAIYFNPAGEEVHYDDGTLSPDPCKATDHEGRILFQPSTKTE